MSAEGAAEQVRDYNTASLVLLNHSRCLHELAGSWCL